MKLAVGILAAVCANPPGVWSQTMSDDDVKKVAQEMVRKHEAWRSQLSTPGTSIQAKAFGRDGAVVRYRLYVSGLPADKLYSVLNWPIDQEEPSVLIEGASIGKDGLVSCTGRLSGECKREMGDELGALDFGFQSVRGEPFRIALATGELRAATVIIPDPINATDRGCTLNVERLTPGFELAYVTGAGYTPGARIAYSSESYGENMAGQTIADAKGRIHFLILPGVAGHIGGTTTVIAAGSACTPSVNFQWGKT